MGSIEQPKIKVAIAGGGVAGLTLAHGLTKHDHLDVQVYESVAQYRDVGAGLALHANAIRAMDLIDPAVKQAYLRKANSMLADDEVEMATHVIMAEGKHMGETIAALGKAKGRKTVARSDLLEGFRGLVPADRLHFSKRLVGIEEHADRVTLKFADGTTAEADCLIGSDGIHSVTRTYLLGHDDPTVQPVNHDRWYRVGRQVPTEEANEVLSDKYLGFVPILCGPRGFLNVMPLHYGKTLSIGVIMQAKSDEDIGRMPNIEDFEEYDPEVKKMVELILRDVQPQDSWIILDHDRAPFYAKGRVVMVGDAAHATTPFIGNGAAQAIEDAAVLNAIFQRVENNGQVPAAFQAFDETRRERSQKTVELSRFFGRLYNYDFGEGLSPDDDLDKLKARLREYAAYTNDADLAVQNQQAVDAFARRVTETKRSKPAEVTGVADAVVAA